MEHLQLLFEKLLSSKTYIQQGLQNLQHDDNQYQLLVESCKLPRYGWNDQTIELFIQQLSRMDSNNFNSNAGVGEREGRVYSSLVARRHYYLAHGIGRSGDIVEVQPKAAGSSILYKLTNKLAAHALTIAGLSNQFFCIVFPLATGMTISLCLNALKAQHPLEKRYVIWSRIDQKSCFKSILSANLIPIIVNPILENEEMKTNIEEIGRLCRERSHEILAVLSTTSCFAPRQPDAIDKIAELCKEYHIHHVINNAYGLQCEVISKLINRAVLKGTVDAVIQSTDKNFLVPVGGAVLASTSESFLKAVSASYPGRASSSPIVDLFITLLSMGESGYRSLLEDRRKQLPIFREKLLEVCIKFGFRLVPSPKNTISFAIDITTLHHTEKPYTFLGSMLFQRYISGCRVVNATSGAVSKINGYEFRNWGSHYNDYQISYFTAACAIGMKFEEIDLFIERLEKTILKFQKLNIVHPSPTTNNEDNANVTTEDSSIISVQPPPCAQEKAESI